MLRDGPRCLRRRRARGLAVLVLAALGCARRCGAQCPSAPMPWTPLANHSGGVVPMSLMPEAAAQGRGAAAMGPPVGRFTLPRVRRVQGESSGQWSPAPYCAREPRSHGLGETRPTTPLALCLQSDQGCVSSGASAQDIAEAAQNLPSMRRLEALKRQKLRCVSVTRGGRCNRMTGNVDTYLAVGKFYSEGLKPQADHPKRLAGSCALVANGPLTMLNRNGASIDAHNHVIRFNAADVGSQKLRLGSKTTHRIFNRPRGSEASGCTRRRCTGIRTGMGQQLGRNVQETWLFWNYESVSDFPMLKRLYSRVSPRLFSPDASRAVYQIYWHARRDLLALGLGPFNCPKSLSSGIHALVLMNLLCDQPLSLYGFTYDTVQLRTRAGHYVKGGPEMFAGHSWTFDAAFVRLLHLAGHARVCTADDPNVKTNALRKGSAPREGSSSSSARPVRARLYPSSSSSSRSSSSRSSSSRPSSSRSSSASRRSSSSSSSRGSASTLSRRATVSRAVLEQRRRAAHGYTTLNG